MPEPINISLKILFSLFFVSILPACSQKAAQDAGPLYTVSGSITQTHAYCGGIRPPDSQLKELRTPRALPGKKLYIKTGSENTASTQVIRELVADSAGHFRLQLPSGTYCIVEKEQVSKLDLDNFRKKKTNYMELDESCLQQWWAKCQLSFEVKAADQTDLQINFYFPCETNGIPCMRYTGPMRQ